MKLRKRTSGKRTERERHAARRRGEITAWDKGSAQTTRRRAKKK